MTEKLYRQVVQATVISNGRSREVEVALREVGFALTRYGGTRRDGPEDVLDVVCTSRGLAHLIETVTRADPKAFLYSQELAGLRGGHVYGVKGRE